MKKLILLIFILVIPASVFIFLKYFGTNTFEVPYLFENGIPNCLQSESPNIVSDFDLFGALPQPSDKYDNSEYLIYGIVDKSKKSQLSNLIIQLIRIQDAFFESDPPYFVLLISGNFSDVQEMKLLSSSMGLRNSNTQYFYSDKSVLYEFLKCEIALIMNNSDELTNIALVDTERKIRGIYAGLDREEVDKLILELKILKQQH